MTLGICGSLLPAADRGGYTKKTMGVPPPSSFLRKCVRGGRGGVSEKKRGSFED